jgi:AraC-like DNA-binding protein
MARYPSLRTTGLAVEHYPCYRNFKLHPHSLDVVLMSFVVVGHGRHYMGSHVFEEEPGCLGITHYGQEHDIITDRGGIDIYNVYLDLAGHDLPSLPAEFRDVLPEVLPLHPHFQNYLNRRVHIRFEDPNRVAWLLGQMERELRTPQAGGEAVVRSYFRVLLIECCRQALRSGVALCATGDGRAVAWVEKVRRRLDHDFRQPQSLQRLAREANVSASHLCRAFKRYTGKRLFNYLIERRIQAAMLALRSTDEKVLSVAMDCGFEDIAYFNRQFKQVVGRTPREYRHHGGAGRTATQG